LKFSRGTVSQRVSLGFPMSATIIQTVQRYKHDRDQGQRV